MILPLRILLLVFSLLAASVLTGQSWQQGNYHSRWGDSLLKGMTLRQQIGQMMMVAAWSNKGPEHSAEVEDLIRKNEIGGLCFFQGHPLKQAYFTNYYQQISKIPMLISIDGEWGLAMRLREMEKFPYQMTLGAANNDTLTYNTGLMMGLQCKRLGIHINFSPVVDVNTNPNNPIIGFRSFGQDATAVAHHANLLMKGMQDAGIIACAKHFPGHGDSDADSHLELPRINADRSRFDSLDFVPFKTLFGKGVKSTMVGHLEIPSLDSVPKRPSSLSPIIVNQILRKELGYKGLIITDALNMKGVSSLYGAGFAEAAAAKAGNDILLFPENVPKAIDLIVEMVRNKTIDSAELAERVRKILYFKNEVGLFPYKPVNTYNIVKELNSFSAKEIQRETAKEAITVVTDKNEELPLMQHTKRKIAWWAVGKAGNYAFGRYLERHHKISSFFTYRDSSYEVFTKMADSLGKEYEQVILSIHDQNLWGKKSIYLPQAFVQSVYRLSENTKVILVLFGNMYNLRNLPNLPCAIAAYEDDVPYQKAAADVIFGEIESKGQLPATAWKGYEIEQGVQTALRFPAHIAQSDAITEGFSVDFTESMDSLLAQTVRKGITPGGQVMVLKNGKAVYHRAYGSFYYDSIRRVRKSDIYDLASITKIAATTLSVMRLWERNLIKLDAHIHDYLPKLQGSNKSKLTVRQLMTHEAGLLPFIPFYKNALSDKEIFSQQPDSGHAVQIADSLWMNKSYQDDMWQSIIASELKNKGEFVYSDLGFIILGKIIERITGSTVAQYAAKHFYRPMNLNHMSFNPSDIYYSSVIAPTVDDNYFRMQRIQGFVHDPTAAMFGGVAGHAGLFSNAEDLAKLMQMMANNGSFEGKQYLKPYTLREFTARQKNTHRGLGFDKPNGLKAEKANVSTLVPLELFGHSGFTGNWAWADPKNNIVFVFLSNRTFPDENNKKLISNNIRTRAIELVYKAL